MINAGERNCIIASGETVTLYHGSKSGIRGNIAPKSRDKCDFGRGFYMGTDPRQPLTLICNYPEAKLYTLSMDLSDLRIMDIEDGLDWVLLVAYNRGKMESIKGTPLYAQYAGWTEGCDIQGRLFELALKAGYDCPYFIKTFMKSRAAALDDVYDRLQWAGEEYILEELDEEAGGLKKAGTVYSREVMYWTGYVYRYWHYYTGENSSQIYKIADEKRMEESWLGFHTLDVEMAIDNLKEIHDQRAN